MSSLAPAARAAMARRGASAWLFNRLAPRLSWLLAGYIVLLYTLGRFEAVQPLVLWVLGPLCFGLVALLYIAKPFRLPPEVLLYLAFGVWTLSGFAGAIDMSAYARYLRLIFQVAVISVCVVTVVARTGRIDLILKAIMAAAGFQFAWSLMYGRTADGAIASVSGNPNDLGYIALLGVIGAAIMRYQHRGRAWPALLLGSSAFLAGAVILSASRKAFLSMALFGLAWAWFAYRRHFGRKPWLVVPLALLLLGGFLGVEYVLKQTYLGERLQEYDSASEMREENVRFRLYEEGLAMFAEHPVTGVGLNQFVVHESSNRAAHSDYLEVLATTGAVGFILYFSIYVVLASRIHRLSRQVANEQVRHHLNTFKAALLALLLVALGRVNVVDFLTHILVATMVGYTWYVQHRLAAWRRWVRSLAAGEGEVTVETTAEVA